MDLILNEQRLATILEDDIKYWFNRELTLSDIGGISLEEITTKVWKEAQTYVDFETDYDIGCEYDNKEEFENWFDSLIAKLYKEKLEEHIKYLIKKYFKGV